MDNPIAIFKKKNDETVLEDIFLESWNILVPDIKLIRQYKFDDGKYWSKKRLWKSDFCIPAERIIIEIDGLRNGKGRHQTVAGFTEDTMKLNTLTLLGYDIFRFTQVTIKNRHKKKSPSFTTLENEILKISNFIHTRQSQISVLGYKSYNEYWRKHFE